uniref:Uncharacterized protein n=1 Tax=Anopheles atroparvus TaxID=41427 RepID=A0A182J2G9_ANOAO
MAGVCDGVALVFLLSPCSNGKKDDFDDDDGDDDDDDDVPGISFFKLGCTAIITAEPCPAQNPNATGTGPLGGRFRLGARGADIPIELLRFLFGKTSILAATGQAHMLLAEKGDSKALWLVASALGMALGSSSSSDGKQLDGQGMTVA